MLQVLCQVLKTDNINDVQAWLVASNPTGLFLTSSYLQLIFTFCVIIEKEAVRQLITSALKGLEESGRIQPTAYFMENSKNAQVNLDTLSSLITDK